MQKGSALKVVILVVAIVVIVLALWMSKDKNNVTTSPAPSTSIKPGSTVSASASPNLSKTDKVVTDLLKIIPADNASQDKVYAFFDAVSKVAKDTNTIWVTDCSIIPSVAKFKKGTTITFKNESSGVRKLSYPSWNVSVPANDQTTLKITTGGVQGYTCDNTTNALFYVID